MLVAPLGAIVGYILGITLSPIIGWWVIPLAFFVGILIGIIVPPIIDGRR